MVSYKAFLYTANIGMPKPSCAYMHVVTGTFFLILRRAKESGEKEGRERERRSEWMRARASKSVRGRLRISPLSLSLRTITAPLLSARAKASRSRFHWRLIHEEDARRCPGEKKRERGYPQRKLARKEKARSVAPEMLSRARANVHSQALARSRSTSSSCFRLSSTTTTTTARDVGMSVGAFSVSVQKREQNVGPAPASINLVPSPSLCPGPLLPLSFLFRASSFITERPYTHYMRA